MTIPQSLIEIVQSLSSAEGYYAVTNDTNLQAKLLTGPDFGCKLHVSK